jgi:hypothetical protein
MSVSGLVLVTALLQAGQMPARHPQPLPEPIVDPVRVEIRVATTARGLRLRVLDDALIVGHATAFCCGRGARASIEGDELVLADNPDSLPATATYRLVLSSRAATLRLAAAVATSLRTASVEVFNLNDETRGTRVAEFTAIGSVELQTNMSLLRTGGPLTAPHRERLVLAHWYPWWDPVAWTNPQLLDLPLRLYSTDDAADVARNLREVAAAGIDSVIVSWQGSDAGGGFNLRRLRYVLEAAQQAGVTVTVHLETLAANRVGVEGATPDPDVLTAWIVELVDTFGPHPAWLKVDGRPVIFAYVWDLAGAATWNTVRERLRASGRTPLLLGDSTNPDSLLLADGLATYSGTLFTPDVQTLMRETASASRAYHLLGANRGSPRIAVATVMPGYDETRLVGRPGRVVHRAGGEFYDRQWQAALASGADWVVISTWNEWAENTQIEAGQRFGEFYVWRTRFWTAALKAAPR